MTEKSRDPKKSKDGHSEEKTQKPLVFEPEQIAVALSYDHKSSKAPRVVASGHGAIAEQILQLAFANGVKVREDADLAEILSAVDIDAEIPLEAFAAVAEILAYVYKANGTVLPQNEEQQNGKQEQNRESAATSGTQTEASPQKQESEAGQKEVETP